MYSWLATNIMAPVLDLARGTRTMKCLKELEKSQWWPRNKILELQNQRLRKLVRHAYDNVPYYRQLLDTKALKPNDIERVEDLPKLPILTKQLVRSNFEKIMATGFPQKELILNFTGGSTGEPLRFYSTRDDLYNWGFAAAQRAFGWTGYKIGDKGVLIANMRPYQSITERIRETVKESFNRIMHFEPSGISVETIPLLVRKLEDFQPKFIMGYPSAIYLLARFIETKRKHKLRLKAIVSGAEQLYDYQRELFTKVFQCETYSHYRSWELNSIACECPEHSGYHISAENVIVEIVDDTGKPVPVGEEGRVVITNLHNYAMPFIRYDMGDLGVASDKACPCGRGLPLLASLKGRITDVIFTRSGKSIPGPVPVNFFGTLDVEQFQIVQESYQRVVVKFVIGGEYSKERTDELTKETTSYLGPILGKDVDIAVEFVDQIPLTEVGKRRVIISNLPPPGEE